MKIDILFAGIMLFAIFKGARNGLIIAIFSTVGWVIGLAAAMKFSNLAADYLKELVNINPKWLSVISFAAVFIIVMLLVRLGARLIEKTAELAMMGWINRIGGIIFYVLLYAFIFSVIIFFAEKAKLLNEEAISSSSVYPWIKPLAHITQLSFLR